MKDIENFFDVKEAYMSLSSKNVKRMYKIFYKMNHPFYSKIGKFLMSIAFKLNIPIGFLFKKTIFKHFCGGENIEESLKTIKKLYEQKIMSILDYSAEGKKDEKSFDITTREVIKTIKLASTNREMIPFAVFKVSGVADSSILEKVGKNEKLTTDEEKRWFHAKERISMLCKTAWEHSIPILIDAEESWIQNTIDSIVYDMMKIYNREKVIVYNTIQMYRTDGFSMLKNAYEMAENEGYFLGVKLVRGAYLERERALDKNKVFSTKKECDDSYNEALVFIAKHIERVAVCVGTHNEESILKMVQLMEEYQIEPKDSHICFAQLFGMGFHISYHLSNKGYQTANYLPYGKISLVLPYLIRRAEENSSSKEFTSREFQLIKKEMKRRKN